VHLSLTLSNIKTKATGIADAILDFFLFLKSMMPLLQEYCSEKYSWKTLYFYTKHNSNLIFDIDGQGHS
jgi:hypothetical protein